MRSMTEKVLVVEDDNSIATLTRLQLESKGYVVTVAHNGTEGLRLAYAWQPDLVILDIMMPDMDGWTVCQRLREMSDVPIIFVAAVGQERNIVRGLQLGADDYIVKPFSTKEMQARIEAVLRRHRQGGGGARRGGGGAAPAGGGVLFWRGMRSKRYQLGEPKTAITTGGAKQGPPIAFLT